MRLIGGSEHRGCLACGALPRIREEEPLPGLVAPHGGAALKPRALSGEALAAETARARSLPAIRISSREKGDLVMLGIGGFPPRHGVLTAAARGGGGGG